ncbi:MAG: hypothetical protein D6796_07450 [Caldilineae bacterium]|nr:MAG: hypothetical protein D6796_07450 [Caldilineae bacterium]
MLVVLAGLAVWMVVAQFTTPAATLPSRFDQEQAAFEAETGIRVVRVVLVGGGGIVDLQYQVLDPDKSLAIHDDDNPPTLVDDASGNVVAIPFHEHSFQDLHTAITYHELLMNGGGLLKRGSKVTLTLGTSHLEGIVVQ